MALDVKFGWKIPVGEVGQRVFDILAENIRLVANHNHDGSNSNKIAAHALAKIPTVLASGSWATENTLQGYYQDVQMPAGLNLSHLDFVAFFTDGDNITKFKPDISILPGNIVRMFFNDSSKDVTLLY